MSRRRRKIKATKRERAADAALGGSDVALAARLGRPGGRHGRRKPVRRIERDRAIREAAGE